MKTFIRSRKGSILAYTLILLGIILAASISMMAASVTNLRSVSSNNQSINAFQIADSGSQAVVKGLKEATGSKLGDVPGVTCSGGDALASKEGFLGGDYKVIFQDSDGKTLKCTDSISDVASVKSVGTYGDTARAVQVAVAAGGCTGHEGEYVLVSENSNETFNNSHTNKVRSFVADGGILTAAACVGPSSTPDDMAFFSSSVIRTSDLSPITFSSDTDSGFSCYAPGVSLYAGTCKHRKGAGVLQEDCADGWRIYGICKPNSF